MGLLTFTQIQAEIKKHHADRSDIDSRLNVVTDLAQMRIARIHEWDQLHFLIRGVLPYTGTKLYDKVYNLAADMPTGYKIKTLYSVRLFDAAATLDWTPVGLNRIEFDKKLQEPSYAASGKPEFFTKVSTFSAAATRVNPALEFWPAPDAAYSIELRLQVWPRFLTDSGKTLADKSDLELDDAIIHLSTSYLFNSLGREEKARFHFGIYKSILEDAQILDDKNFETSIVGVRVDGGRAISEYWNDPFITETP